MLKTNGLLLIYAHPFQKNAATITEHVQSFLKYSRFKIWAVNTYEGFPTYLPTVKFQAIITHYSFANWMFDEPSPFIDYLKNEKDAYKIAFFQDEMHNCKKRFNYLNDCGINCVYTLLDLQYMSQVYGKFTKVQKFLYTLTGYVDDQLPEIGRKFAKPDAARSVDVGYRARELPFYMGKGGQEKIWIARDFLKHAAGTGLKCDIATHEGARIYGDDWYRFIGNSKATLGVESGVSVFDLDQSIQQACEKLQAERPGITFDEVHDLILKPHEENIPYRTSSPRLFEAAALRSCQILYEGNYSGVLRPYEHYIPVKKDFSNFDEVLRIFRDERERAAIVERAYQHLIASQKFT